MKRRHILVAFGTRPEAIKLAPVVGRLGQRTDACRLSVVATGQHREMLDQVTSLFGIVPDLDLDLMRPNQDLAGLTSEAMRRFDEALEKTLPDIVLVQGDTTTAMVCALASFYRRIPVGHVEAGLRTRDRYRPFPEEINRRVITTLATWNFAPTLTAVRALRSEGVAEETIHLTGNTVIDALLQIVARPEQPSDAPPFPSEGLDLILVTAHRRESFGEPFEGLCRALRELAERNPRLEVVYPVHLNPNVQAPVRRILEGAPRVRLIEPLGYLAFARLMSRSTLILTDSGGIQEEAPALGVPVLVMREETERPEAIEAGTARLVGTDPARIVSEAERLLRDPEERRRMCAGGSPFGDGHAAERIAAVLLDGSSFPARQH